jgi:hypothetical protein
MIISPPFLPDAGRTANDDNSTDPMMDAVDAYEAADGLYPIAADRRWHPGMHLTPRMYNERIHAIADGEVIAYRVCQRAYDGGGGSADSNAGFVLLKHTTETGEGRKLTFYSLYMHLLELNGYQSLGSDKNSCPSFCACLRRAPALRLRLSLRPNRAAARKCVEKTFWDCSVDARIIRICTSKFS